MEQEKQQRGPGRPATSDRGAIERAALSIMLREGYENVSIKTIAEAAGIGRTSLFRFFGSKPGIIWTAFDETISELNAELLASEQKKSPATENIRAAIVASTRTAFESSDMWLQRFEILDTSPELRSGAYDHWERWKNVIVDHLVEHSHFEAEDNVPMVVASAYQAVFVSVLRSDVLRREGSERVLKNLDGNLEHIGPAMDLLLRNKS